MPQDIDAPVSDLDLRKKIKMETLNTLASNGASSFLLSVVNAVIVYVVFREVAEPIVLNLWLATIVFSSLVRVILIGVFYRMNERSKRFTLWTTLYILFVYVSAVCWGVMPLWDVFGITEWSETFIVFVIAGMSAGGLVSLYPMLVAAIPYSLIILLPLIYVLALRGEPSHVGMAVLASMFLILLIRSTYSLNKSATNTIRLEIENTELFKFLYKARQ